MAVTHEIGHNLGLDDVLGSDLGSENAIMEGVSEGLVDLQPDDRKDIRKQVWDVNAFAQDDLASREQPAVGEQSVVLGLAVDAPRVYATRYRQLITAPEVAIQPGVLVILDRQTLQPVPGLPQISGFPRGIPVGYGPRSLAVNPKTGKIFVVKCGLKSYSVSVIDGNR